MFNFHIEHDDLQEGWSVFLGPVWMADYPSYLAAESGMRAMQDAMGVNQ